LNILQSLFRKLRSLTLERERVFLRAASSKTISSVTIYSGLEDLEEGKTLPSEVSFITAEKSGNYVCSNDSRWYYFNSDGTMAANTIINGFLINENGVWYK
jgi:hypothetical protein